MDQPVDKALLKKFIAGECTAAEQRVVNHFLQEPQGKLLLNTLMQEQWEAAEGFQVDDMSLQQWKGELEQRLGLPAAQNTELKIHRQKNYFLRNAAIWTGIILCFAAYGVLNFKNNKLQQEKNAAVLEQKINPYGRRSSFLLSDSTRVYLGAGSKLSYTRRFLGEQRTVHLEGEAYFEVTKNPKKPFVIYTGKVRTMVLGTSFKVTAFAGQPLSVAVTTGKVRVDRIAGDHQLQSLAVLTPGLKLTYNQGKAYTGQAAVEDTEKWKKGVLVFKAVPLQQLLTEVGRWYNVRISIRRKSLESIPVSVSLDANVPVNKLLDGLAAVTGLKYELKNKNTVAIY